MTTNKSHGHVEKWVGKVDKIVTGIILWAAVASIFWLSKTKKWQEVSSYMYEQSKTGAKRSIWVFWKLLAFFVSVFSKRK